MPALTCGNQVGSAAPSATPPIQCLYLHILTPGCLPSDTLPGIKVGPIHGSWYTAVQLTGPQGMLVV